MVERFILFFTVFKKNKMLNEIAHALFCKNGFPQIRGFMPIGINRIPRTAIIPAIKGEEKCLLAL